MNTNAIMNLAGAGVEGMLTRLTVFLAIVVVFELAIASVVFVLAWPRAAKLVGTLKPVHVDGSLYVQIAMYGFVITWMSEDDAYKYVNPYVIFYIKGVMGAALAGTGALKMFRSTGYSDSLKKDAAAPAAGGSVHIGGATGPG